MRSRGDCGRDLIYQNISTIDIYVRRPGDRESNTCMIRIPILTPALKLVIICKHRPCDT